MNCTTNEDYVYKVELNGGELNGAERYYDTLGMSYTQAYRYLRNQKKKGGTLGESLWVEIEKVNRHTGKKERIDIID